MRIRFPWIAAVLALLSIGFVIACSTKYSASSNGLLVVPSRDSQAMETFTIDLSNGHASQINNVNGPPITGLPSSVIIDPAGSYAYVAATVDCTAANLSAVQGAILAYKINSDGKLSASNPPVYLSGNPAYPSSFPTCGLDDAMNPNPGNPVAAFTMDSGGKFLFVATAQASAIFSSSTATLPSQGIAVYSVGANASLTQVTGSPFTVPGTGGQAATPSALAVTHTVFPAQFAPCSAVPSTENLYVSDSINNMLFNYMVTSAGSLSLVTTGTNPIPTGTLPSGVAVDPCNRFVYVANSNSNNVSAYTICNVVSPTCLVADYSLLKVAGSPFPVGDFPGPITTDAFGKALYVVNTGASTISGFSIGPATGNLTPLSPATVATNLGSNSIAVRSDDSWLFVANSTAANVSQFSITPATGSLTMVSAIATFNLPSGVAVK